MKPILFIDFDGTLCHDRFWRSASPEIVSFIQERLFGPDKTLVVDWMNGRYSSEEVNKILSTEIGIPFSELWKLFISDCQTMNVERVVLDQINALRGSYKTVLVTDNMDCFDRFTVPALGLNKYFDEIVNSFNEKQSKGDKDGALFKTVAERHSAEIGASFLFDNSNGTCQLFDQIGGRACFVTQDKDLSYWLRSFSTV